MSKQDRAGATVTFWALGNQYRGRVLEDLNCTLLVQADEHLAGNKPRLGQFAVWATAYGLRFD